LFRDQWEDVIGLVGKGITFDTGGYSIKPKTGIVGMKSIRLHSIGRNHVVRRRYDGEHVLFRPQFSDNFHR
jgi:hypothetical protein